MSALTITDATFDPGCNLLLRPAASPGYHTKLAAGTPSHPTRESMDYALALFETNEPWRHERAREILAKIIELQEKDPTSQWFGLWGWFLEEPPPAMGPADWNWADFIGVRFAEIIARFANLLTVELLVGARATLGRAGWCIFRRNVRTDYTNISAMGAAACLAAGELLAQPTLFAYGLQRLRNLRTQLEFDGGFWEYNSSTYTLVALIEFERILGLVHDPEARAEAETLLDHTWRLISEHFHPGTGQWAGPACRSYNDWLDEPKLTCLEERLGFTLPYRDGPKIGFFSDGFRGSHPRPCPAAYQERFRALPSNPYVYKNCWVRTTEGVPAQVSTTWYTDEATLGSMNRESTFGQRRVVLGYWSTPEDAAIRLRLRILHNGRDFSSGFVWNDQEGPRILTGAHFVTDQGDFHPTLDRPADGTLLEHDLRLRFEMEGRGLGLEQTGERCYMFSAGAHRAVVHVGPGWFDGQPLDGWVIGQDGDIKWLDYVFHAGSPIAFNPALRGETSVALAVELLSEAEAPSPHEIRSSTDATHRRYEWQSDRAYKIRVPLQSQSRPWP